MGRQAGRRVAGRRVAGRQVDRRVGGQAGGQVDEQMG